jgi:predicted regulator of Ras-like GTPase activity (Roadblock/LC7/MglB family)
MRAQKRGNKLGEVFMATKKELLEDALSELYDSLGGDLLGALIATPDGQVVVSKISKSNLDPQKLAAMAAAVVGTSDRLSKLVDAGAPMDTLVRCANENIMARKAGRRAVLVCVVKQDANIGLLNIEVEDAVNKITSILGM